MIQSPNTDGPPDLDAYFDNARRSIGATGPPINFSTARALLVNNHNDPTLTVKTALEHALDSLGSARDSAPHLVHVTHSLDVDPHLIANEIKRRLNTTPVVGRSVNKRHAHGTVELMLLRTGSDNALSFGCATVPVAATDEQQTPASKSSSASDRATASAAKQAASSALAALGEAAAVTFMVFAHSPAAGGEAAARRGLDEARQGVIAYGGPGVGAEQNGLGWSVLGGVGDGVKVFKEQQGMQTAVVAAVCGSIPFLASAVVKTWAQPAFVKALPFMTPTYVGDPSVDLLTAIRYDDWDKFVWCIEEEGVDVNVKWKEKQNQIPLLAACARARTKMIRYLLERGADVRHRNDGGFTAAMYTRMLTEYDRAVIEEQLSLLEGAGADTKLTEEEARRLKQATNGRIVE